MICSFSRVCLLAGAMAVAVFSSADSAYAVSAILTDDAYAANDPNRGPGVTGDRNEASAFFEVRHHSAPRKKIGYLKYDISGIDPSVYATATLSGGFSTSSHDGAGLWSIYGLNDAETNTDDVADGTFGEANWTEDSLSYSRGLGVDVSVLPEDANNLGFDLTEVTLIGTISLPGDAPFQSNPVDLPLGAFLGADTNGSVTFLIADAAMSGTEWRVRAMENTSGPGVALSFVPEPSSIGLLAMLAMSLLCVRRTAPHE